MRELASPPVPQVRLSEQETERLCDIFDRLLSDDARAHVYLFGSRSDPSALGGDLDLLVVSAHAAATAYQTRKMLRLAIHEALGEQKVDILISADPDDPTEPALTRIAHLEGVRIWP